MIRVPKDMGQLRTAALSRKDLHQKTVFLNILLSALIEQQQTDMPLCDRETQTRRLLRELLGSPEGWGILQWEMEAQTSRILTRLKKDMPDLRKEEILLVSYLHAGFTNRIIGMLLHMDEGYVSVLHSRLRERISKLDAAFRDEYLAFVPERACRIGQEMLYLHNL